MERVHQYTKLEDATSEKVKTGQGEKHNVHKDSRGHYARGQVLDNTKYKNIRHSRSNSFPHQNRTSYVTRHDGRNEVATVSKNKREKEVEWDKKHETRTKEYIVTSTSPRDMTPSNILFYDRN